MQWWAFVIVCHSSGNCNINLTRNSRWFNQVFPSPFHHPSPSFIFFLRKSSSELCNVWCYLVVITEVFTSFKSLENHYVKYIRVYAFRSNNFELELERNTSYLIFKSSNCGQYTMVVSSLGTRQTNCQHNSLTSGTVRKRSDENSHPGTVFYSSYVTTALHLVLYRTEANQEVYWSCRQ